MWSAEDERARGGGREFMHIGVWQEASEEHERRQAKKRAAASVYGGKGMAKPDYTTKLNNADIYGGTK